MTWCDAQAQQAQSETPAGTATAAPGVLEEVTVTAEKRTENVQKTSIAMTVLSGDSLAQVGMQSFEQAVADVPSLQPDIGPGGMRYTMRGVNASKNAPAVSTSIDGISVGATGPSRYLEYSMFDVARVEVLQGPQGTLAGRNALAGSVNVITNDPVDRYEGAASLGFGNFNAISGDAMLNLPLSDSVLMRAAFSTDRRDGYYSNKQSDQNYTAGRVKFLITPTDRLTARLSADFMRVDEHGGGEVLNLDQHPGDPWQVPNITIPGVDAGYTNYCAILPISGPGAGNTGKVKSTQSQCDLNYYYQRDYHIKGQIDYEFDFADLTVLSGYENNWTQQYAQAIGHFPDSSYSKDNQTSVEARLASPASSSIKWVIGTYWQQNRSGFPDGYGGTGISGAKISNTSGKWSAAKVSMTTKSVFGQATLPVTDAFRVIAGVRYNQDDTEVTTWSVPADGSTEHVPGTEGVVTRDFIPTPGSFNNSEGSWNKLVWKGGVEFDLAPQSMLYATVATGYSAGLIQPTNVCDPAFPYGGNSTNPGCFTSPTTQDATTGGNTVGKEVRALNTSLAPNALTSYELGVKNRFLDDRLQLNVAAYLMRFSHYQQGSFKVDVTGANGAGTSTDLQGAESMGLQVSSTFLATPVDRISLDVGYNKTKVGDANNPWSDPFDVNNGFQTCIGTDALHIPLPYGCHRAVGADDRLALAPLWSGNLAYEHTFPLPSGASLSARADMHYQSSTFTAADYYPDSFQGSWSRYNASLNYESADGKYEVSAWVRNLTNEAIIAKASNSSAGDPLSECQPTTPALALTCSGTPVFLDLQPPRTFGINVSTKF